jgi:hypothetical protein
MCSFFKGVFTCYSCRWNGWQTAMPNPFPSDIDSQADIHLIVTKKLIADSDNRVLLRDELFIRMISSAFLKPLVSLVHLFARQKAKLIIVPRHFFSQSTSNFWPMDLRKLTTPN